jgi:hypothetical protein
MIGVKYLQDTAYHGLGLVDGEQRRLRIRLNIEPPELSFVGVQALSSFLGETQKRTRLRHSNERISSEGNGSDFPQLCATG